MMRLWGPVPFSAAKSIPLSAASFFANGLAKILSPAGKQAQNIVIVLKPARRAHGPEGRAGAAGAAAGAGGGGGRVVICSESWAGVNCFRDGEC